MARPQRDSRTEHGEQFESEVAEIYAAMGFQVRRHVPVQGQEVDIVAERRIPGADPYRVMVECKYKGGNTLAGNADVQAIAGAYQIARNTHQVSACTLVTTNGFSLPAQETARAAGIHTVTRRELVQGLLDFSPYHRTLREEYARDFGSGGDSWYIPARARQDETSIDSLMAFVDEWRAREQKQPLVILGGYGTGKTSFCRDYAIQLLDRGEAVFPVIISLREFQKATKIESLIRDFLEEQCDAGAPRFDAFWRMYQEGLVLLMFDGFDEMASRVDSSVLEMNLTAIEKFARGPANMILTCRPEVFITRMEELRALEPGLDSLSLRRTAYERVAVELWTPEQIKGFVCRRVVAIRPAAAHPPEFYLERIERLPELHDMSARAVHLDLIVRMLPHMVAQHIPITRINLYRTYLEHELRRETVQNRRLRVISDEDRLALIREIAARSFLEQRDALDFDTATALVKRVLNPPRAEVDVVTRDLLNRSFLHRSGDTYQFAHKSIGEYLFATYLFDALQAGRHDVLQKCESSAAVAGMVLELFGGLTSFWAMASALGIPSEKTPKVADHSAISFAVEGLLDYLDLVSSLVHRMNLDLASTVRLMCDNLRNSLGFLLTNLGLLTVPVAEQAPKSGLLRYIQKRWRALPTVVAELQRLDVDRFTGDLSLNLQRTCVKLYPLIRGCMAETERNFVYDSSDVEYEGDRMLLGGAFRAIASIIRDETSEGARIQVSLRKARGGVSIDFVLVTSRTSNRARGGLTLPTRHGTSGTTTGDWNSVRRKTLSLSTFSSLM